MPAKTIMIQGTSSDVGKSIIVTALCRLFFKDGFKTAPFKSQNMSLNSYPTKDGKEIGIAQAIQAEAAGVEISTDMNPLLLKPTSNRGSQVIVEGKSIGTMDAKEYMNEKENFFQIISDSLNRLERQYDIVVIEGAGSPAEINLKQHDIVNMRIAHRAHAPVILVGDIDRGGVFAAFVGTLKLLDKKDRARIKGFIINKFRGDFSLLENGLTLLKEKTGIPVLGVLPYIADLSIQAEDSLSVKSTPHRRGAKITVGVIKLPMMSNFTDFEPLTNRSDVNLKYIITPEEMYAADIIIIPGTKNTIDDLLLITSKGFIPHLHRCVKKGAAVIGICGGYQMLGKSIIDKNQVESDHSNVEGIGLLDMITTFNQKKTTEQIQGVVFSDNCPITGYEIHMGESEVNFNTCKPMFKITKKGNKQVSLLDGCRINNGTVWGTYIHGLFHNEKFRTDFLNKIREKKGLTPLDTSDVAEETASDYDRLSSHFKKHIDMEAIYSLMGLKKHKQLLL